MLPFLKSKKDSQISGLIIKNRTPDVKEDNQEPNDNSAAIEACAQDLINAIHAKNTKAVADALSDAFEILDSLPHNEGENLNDYANRNEQAAKESNE